MNSIASKATESNKPETYVSIPISHESWRRHCMVYMPKKKHDENPLGVSKVLWISSFEIKQTLEQIDSLTKNSYFQEVGINKINLSQTDINLLAQRWNAYRVQTIWELRWLLARLNNFST